MSDVASLSVQEQQFFDSVQQAIDNQNLDRLILSQYKGELTDLEKMTFRVIQLQQESVLSCLYRYKKCMLISFNNNYKTIPMVSEFSNLKSN